MQNSVNNQNKNCQNQNPQNEETLLKTLLLKKAQGFTVKEVVEESIIDEDKKTVNLVKRKTTTKEIPPDMNAIKYLLEIKSLNAEDKYSTMTDEELRQEKINLLKLLKEEEE